MRAPTVILAALVAAAVAAGADPTLVGSKTADWLIDLKVKDVPNGTGIIWDVYSQDTGKRVGTKRIVKTEQAILFAGPKGKYDVLVRLVKGEDITELTDVVEITGGVVPTPPGPGPIPPGPTPDPTPPAPIRKDVSYRIVFVEETSEAVGGRGALLTNKALDAQIKAKGHTIRIVDKDVVDDKGQTPKDLVDILPRAAGRKYPQVFLVDKAGKLLMLQFDAPATAAEVLKLLTDNGG